MRRFALIGLLTATVFAYGQDESSIIALLKRSVNNTGARYIGVRTVDFRRGPNPSSHTEYVTRDGKKLRIEFPKDSPMAGQIIVENSLERRHFIPELNEIRVLPPRRQEAFERISRFVGSRGEFRFSMGGEQSVAGKNTEQVVISDRSGNVMQRIFIEPNSGVMLKRDLFDPVGARVGGFEFTEIDLNPHLRRDLFRLERKGARVVTPLQMLQDLARREGFRPYSLPEVKGVRLEWSGTREIEGSSVLIQSYTSHMGRLTLFQLRKSLSEENLSRFARGKANFVSWRREGRTFVLIGETDTDTLRKLAAPISRGNQG